MGVIPPAVARRLLKRGDAAVWRTYPFTIILKRVVPEEEVETHANILCWDPGSKTSGVAIVSDRDEKEVAGTPQKLDNNVSGAMITE